MVKQLEAVFEGGVLRPLAPLALPEHQRVTITIDTREAQAGTAAAKPYNDRKAEMAWLAAHSDEYRGQWVALEGDTLLSHGPKGVAVRDEAVVKGVERPFLVHIALDYDLPSAGFLQL